MKEKVKTALIGSVFIIVALILLVFIIHSKLNQSEHRGYEYTEGKVVEKERIRKQPGRHVMVSYSAIVKFTTVDGKEITFDTGYIFSSREQLDEPLVVRYDPDAIYYTMEVVKKDIFTGRYVNYENKDNILIMIFGLCILIGMQRFSRLMKEKAEDFTLGIGFLIAGVTTSISAVGEDLIFWAITFGGIFLIAGSVFMICAIRDIRKAKKAKETDELQSYNGI